ncbi:MAG: S8 family serine peptidase [Bacteroidia bacterium]|nr:S8 family serine peptidase [Bacteroidia bacterium]
MRGQSKTERIFLIKSEQVDSLLHNLSIIEEIKDIKQIQKYISIKISDPDITKTPSLSRFISEYHQESLSPKTESIVRDLNLGNTTLPLLKNEYPFLEGNLIFASIKENSFDTTDIDLLQNTYWGTNSSSMIESHATDMATIVGGKGLSSVQGEGVAPQSVLFSNSFTPPLPDPDSIYKNQQSWVQNHSYGTEPEGFYGTLARSFDESAIRNPKLIHIFSAGNLGTAMDSTGPYKGVKGFSNLTGNFKYAKNILTVGALDTLNQAMFFSSRGPAYDGRIKPELSAYSLEGTSNAAATVSGTAILLQQAYLLEHDSLPSASLLKCLLLTACEDIGSPGPSYDAGFGMLDPYKSFKILEQGQFMEEKLSQGDSIILEVDVTEDISELKLSITWTDPAANILSSKALVNDLDLYLLTPSGEKQLPWILSSIPNKDELQKAATKGEDHLNNVEQISLQNPVSGKYKVVIKAHKLTQGDQSFSFAYSFTPKNYFAWHFPVQDVQLPFDNESFSYVRWKSTQQAENASLSYSIDGGSTWIEISDAIELDKSCFRWTPPKLMKKAILKMELDKQEFISPSFYLARPIQANIAYQCDDEIFLTWPSSVGVNSYTISTLQGDSLGIIYQGVDSSLSLNQNQLEQDLLSLSYTLSDGEKFIKGNMVDISRQASSCYINSFFAEPKEDGIRLALKLGTISGIDRISIDRTNPKPENIFNDIPTTDSLSLLDQNPSIGLNNYQVTIIRNNGDSILSELALEFFIPPDRFLVFPNPLGENKVLNIFSLDPPDEESFIVLLDVNGREIQKWQVFGERESLELDEIPGGLYYLIFQASKPQFLGKIQLPD